MPALAYESARDLVPLRPFDPATWRADQAARRARMWPTVRVAQPDPPSAVCLYVDYGVPFGPPARPTVTVRAIIAATGRHFGIPPSEIVGQRRCGPIVRARQIAAYITYELTRQSMPWVGRQFGNRDHTTILHAIRRVQGWIDRNDLMTVTALREIKHRLGIIQ